MKAARGRLPNGGISTHSARFFLSRVCCPWRVFGKQPIIRPLPQKKRVWVKPDIGTATQGIMSEGGKKFSILPMLPSRASSSIIQAANHGLPVNGHGGHQMT